MRWQFVDCYSTRLRMRQDLYFTRRLSHPWNDNSSTTIVLDQWKDKISISQEGITIHEERDKSTTTGLAQPLHFQRRNFSSARWLAIRLPRYSKKQLKTASQKKQPTDRPSTEKKYYTSQCSKVLQWTHIHTKELYNSCLSFRRWLQATDNLISDGLYFCDVFRESLLRTANGHPITNKGQVRRREKGFD